MKDRRLLERVGRLGRVAAPFEGAETTLKSNGRVNVRKRA